jgi:hypothetical protein
MKVKRKRMKMMGHAVENDLMGQERGVRLLVPPSSPHTPFAWFYTHYGVDEGEEEEDEDDGPGRRERPG